MTQETSISLLLSGISQALAEHLSQSALMALSVARGQLTDEDATAILRLGRKFLKHEEGTIFWPYRGGFMGFHGDLVWFNAGLMGFHGRWMEWTGDLMGFRVIYGF